VARTLAATPELPAFEAVPVELAPMPARRQYESIVRQVQAAIHRGDLHKAVVSRRLDLSFPVDLPASYALGLTRNTPARSFLLALDGRQCAGFSPETAVEVDANGLVRTQPLAGTRPLLHRPERDDRLREELRWNVKECYEHVISARLAAEEMLAVCDPATVAVRDLMTIKRRGTVQHLASMVTGQLLPGLTAWDAAAALLPAVTASGIPKAPALDLISELEGDERGLYAGAVCTVGGTGSLDAALVLRSMFQDADGAWLRAGAGIVADSNPPDEYDETTNKLRSAADCLVAAGSTFEPVGHLRSGTPIPVNSKES
jgi:salicylate synthase